jgi:hypothetical protein
VLAGPERLTERCQPHYLAAVDLQRHPLRSPRDTVTNHVLALVRVVAEDDGAPGDVGQQQVAVGGDGEPAYCSGLEIGVWLYPWKPPVNEGLRAVGPEGEQIAPGPGDASLGVLGMHDQEDRLDQVPFGVLGGGDLHT